MNAKPIWQMVQDSARELTKNGRTPFTRQDLIELVQRHSPACDQNSINPIIQGMTDNLKGGAPGADGKNILHSVGRGQFVLHSKRGEAVKEPSPVIQQSKKSELELPAAENDLRDIILAKLRSLLDHQMNLQLTAEGRLGYQLPDGFTIYHASDILVTGNLGKSVSIELKYRSAVTDQFKCRSYDAIHMKKELGGNVLCIMIYVKSNTGISIKQAERICYPFDWFYGIPVDDFDRTDAWIEISGRISEFMCKELP
jgi:hypothetical protein